MIDIGFIGLGTMGRPMAHHLLAAGHRVFLQDVAPIAPELKAGGVVCKTGREVAEEADAIIIMVPDTPQVEAVLFG
ncbi:MAG: NAD(P)-binding domain-containing protein, partial [Bradyrhizobium sp.]|nr:NAD(P)-binding domain-containing protein [Bradyrhizobium sp.]